MLRLFKYIFWIVSFNILFSPKISKASTFEAEETDIEINAHQAQSSIQPNIKYVDNFKPHSSDDTKIKDTFTTKEIEITRATTVISRPKNPGNTSSSFPSTTSRTNSTTSAIISSSVTITSRTTTRKQLTETTTVSHLSTTNSSKTPLKTTPTKPNQCCPSLRIYCSNSGFCPGLFESEGHYSMLASSPDCHLKPNTFYVKPSGGQEPLDVYLYRNKYSRWVTSVVMCDSSALIASKGSTGACPEDVPDHSWVYIEEGKEHDGPHISVSCLKSTPTTKSTTVTTPTTHTSTATTTTTHSDSFESFPHFQVICVAIVGIFCVIILPLIFWCCSTRRGTSNQRPEEIRTGIENPSYTDGCINQAGNQSSNSRHHAFFDDSSQAISSPTAPPYHHQYFSKIDEDDPPPTYEEAIRYY